MSPEQLRAHHQPRVELLAARPYVGIPARAGDEAAFRAAMHDAVPAALRWVLARGLRPAGGPFVRYRCVDERAVPPAGPPPASFEACVPLDAPPCGVDGRLLADELPAGRWIVALHRGGYDGLGALHRIVREWATAEGLWIDRTPTAEGTTAFGGSIEHFRVGPFEEPDPWRWETDVAYLVAGD
ncbi:hypothetical protein [Patulibacter sp.]|uniref:hypothetical protein n=1 Tax=Patulibacter sp. TaxID=1912859 RepID=UPI002728DB64|nr:hypothetical protein [Patulibacter sp.]MDO9408725.1 hypothetical protein [Patulibacter sp.]